MKNCGRPSLGLPRAGPPSIRLSFSLVSSVCLCVVSFVSSFVLSWSLRGSRSVFCFSLLVYVSWRFGVFGCLSALDSATKLYFHSCPLIVPHGDSHLLLEFQPSEADIASWARTPHGGARPQMQRSKNTSKLQIKLFKQLLNFQKVRGKLLKIVFNFWWRRHPTVKKKLSKACTLLTN